MNAKEISDATLESITPADNDLMLIYDTSAGTTGKATIADIINNSSVGDIISLPSVQVSNLTTGETGALNVRFLKLRSHRGIVFVDGSIKNSFTPGTVHLSFSIPDISSYTILSIQGSESGNTDALVAYCFVTDDFYMINCIGGNRTIHIRASLICDVSN